MATELEVQYTAEMQSACIETYLGIMSGLRVGMSEYAIASAMRAELERVGIKDYWYDVPIVVLIGESRFLDMASNDYALIEPKRDVLLSENQTVFVDVHPRHASGRWGNFAATGIYAARTPADLDFLLCLQRIQGDGIDRLSSRRTASEIAQWFRSAFQQAGIELVDHRGNFGHTMGSGPKEGFSRVFIDEHHQQPLDGEIVGIEPGGMRHDETGRVVVARFEDCIYLPSRGAPLLLGRRDALPVSFPS